MPYTTYVSFLEEREKQNPLNFYKVYTRVDMVVRFQNTTSQFSQYSKRKFVAYLHGIQPDNSGCQQDFLFSK